MNLSFSSVLNASLFGLVLIGSIYLLGRNRSFLRKINPSILILLAYVILLRLVCPIEFPFTISVYYKGILSYIPAIIIRTKFYVFATRIRLTNILFVIWIIGCAITLCKYILEYRRTVKLLNMLEPVEDSYIAETVRKVNQRLGREKAFRIVYLPGAATPMIFGLRKAYIILPEKELPEDERFYVLYHELVHYYRGHLYIKMMFALLICIYWWNPFIYVLNRFVSDFLEMEVDNVIANDLDELEGLAYMECLLNRSKAQLGRSRILKNSATFCERNTSLIANRIKLLYEKEERENSPVFSGIVVLSFLAVFVLSSALIFEPDTYVSNPLGPDDEDAESVFGFVDNGTFMIRKENGEYDLYIDFVYVYTVDHPLSDDEYVRIYDSLEEAMANEKVNEEE